MSGAWFDRVGVALIVAAAGVYLLRRAVRRASVVFGPNASGSNECAADCGCGGQREVRSSSARPAPKAEL